MPLELSDHWVWDFWLADDGPQRHIFFLKAPRDLGNERLRHFNARVGHAVSRDLRSWTVLPDALGPGEPGEWDDLAIWTGSVVQTGNGWAMLYTGLNRQEGGRRQSIGLATSIDLMRWTKHPANPVIAADGRFYELLDLRSWYDESWRDPWLFVDSDDGQYHALITGRSRKGAPDGRGTVAHARSQDLVRWEVLPPVCGSGDFGFMEVPQVTPIGDRWYLLYSVFGWVSSARRLRTLDQRIAAVPSGIRYRTGVRATGPFGAETDRLLYGDRINTLYAGKLVTGADGRTELMGFEGSTDREDFAGRISDPLPVRVSSDGRLDVTRRRLD